MGIGDGVIACFVIVGIASVRGIAPYRVRDAHIIKLYRRRDTLLPRRILAYVSRHQNERKRNEMV